MEQDVASLAAAIAIIVGLSVTYDKTFAPYQTGLSEIVIQAFRVTSRYKPAVNLGVGILIASAVTVVAAAAVGNAAVIAGGVVGGIMASIESQRVHDTQSALAESQQAGPPQAP